MFDDCSTGKYISASPHVQPVVQHIAYNSDHRPPFLAGAILYRWPIGFSDGQYSARHRLVDTVTQGDSAVSAVSADVNDRPRSNGIPIVSK